MNNRTFCALSAAFLSLAVACSDEDAQPSSPGGAGHSGGSSGAEVLGAGASGRGSGGRSVGGQAGSDAGAPNGPGDVAGAGGGPVSCEPPRPPEVAEGAPGEGDASSDVGLAIVGDYTDDFMGEHGITSAAWTSSSSVFHISEFSNVDRYAIARNDAANPFSPCRWSRFEWVSADGKLYYCQSVYDAATDVEARAATRADAADLMAGCHSFSWSELVSQ